MRADAPEGWVVAFRSDGSITARPSANIQSGTYFIHVAAQSESNHMLVARGEFKVVLTDSEPGVSVQVMRDELYTVPLAGLNYPPLTRPR